MLDPSTLVSGRDLWELLDARVAATPDTEMACDDRGRRITYAEFRQRAEEVAAGIAALGIGAEDVVSWSLPTGFDALVLSAALRRLDVVQNPIIPIYREREVALLRRNRPAPRCSSCPACGAASTTRRWRGSIAKETPGLDVLVVDTTADPTGLPTGDPAPLPPRAAPPATTADGPVRWYFYTSGTTSDPKGARHGDIALDHVAGAMAERLDTPTATAPASRSRTRTSAASRGCSSRCRAAWCSCSTRPSTRSARRATSRRRTSPTRGRARRSTWRTSRSSAASPTSRCSRTSRAAPAAGHRSRPRSTTR